MIIQKYRQVERHKNGQIAYFCTWAEISPLSANDYPGRIEDKDGRLLIRIGFCMKFFSNRQLAWCLKYDKRGLPINGYHKAFRKDGTPIQY